MNAQEMFEELGYKKVKYSMEILTYKRKNHYVLFKYNQTYHYYYIKKKTRHTLSCFPILLEKAITQQMKELGWLDE